MRADVRRVVATMFLGRAESELRASQAFVVVRDALVLLGAEDVLVEMAALAIDEELHHVELCRDVASHYAERKLEPAWRPLSPPRFVGASPRLDAILQVLGMCSLSETTGDAFLARTLKDTSEALPRTALLGLITNEIDHSRIGWGLLASRVIDDELRAQIGGWLPALCQINLQTWRRRPGLPALSELAAHGCQAWESIDAVVVDTFGSLILPGFAALGIDTRPAGEWLKSVQPCTPMQHL